MKLMTVHEVSALTGVSVRALHHYDAVGLVRPAKLTDAGYRLYGEEEIARLRTVLFFRELDFSLAEIRRMIDDPSFDARSALGDQLRLLEMKRSRLDAIISLARETIKKGEDIMDFSAFDKKEIDGYAAEVKERWGKTDAYAQSERREAARSRIESEMIADGMMKIFARFGELRGGDPASAEAKTTAGELRAYITENYYDCTKEIFASLGAMYVGDERFRENIDKVGGNGTAEFASAAVAAYCAE